MPMKPICRKLIAIVLFLTMLLPLAACSFSGGETAQTPAAVVPAETAAPTAEPTPYEVPADLPLRISEVMPSNKATLAAGSLFPDWVELHNAGEEPVSLRNVFLCCGTDSFELGEGELAADAYMIVFCDDSGLSGHAPFSIAKEGESLALRTDRGVIRPGPRRIRASRLRGRPQRLPCGGRRHFRHFHGHARLRQHAGGLFAVSLRAEL